MHRIGGSGRRGDNGERGQVSICYHVKVYNIVTLSKRRDG